MGNCISTSDKYKKNEKNSLIINTPPTNPIPSPPPSQPQPQQPQQQQQLQPQTHVDQNKILYIALFNYEQRSENDLSFKKGDILEILDCETLPGWWIAEHFDYTQQKKRTGYIPSQYVAKLQSVESNSWYFGTTKRIEAEKLLLLQFNQTGSYLIRTSDSSNHAYSLSLRDKDSVKHYRIRRLDEDGTYYIARKITFKTINELVDYYSKTSELCVQLSTPCLRLEQPVTDGLTYKQADSYETERTNFKLIRKCGQGQFGDVYEGVFNGKIRVAIKTLKPNCMNPQEFLAEAALMKKLKHAKLMQLYALCTKEDPIYIVTEFMSNGSLLEFLQGPVGKKLEFTVLVDISAQIADGMAYLEEKNFIHRDLAARNILVGENNDVKIADFGLARFLKEQNDVYAASEGSKFPIKWTAPEAALYNQFTVKSDVWSFGILMCELVTYGRIPYPGMSNTEVVQKVTAGYRMPQPANCPKHFYDVMLDCWHSNFQDRPTFNSLKHTLENFFENDNETQYREN
jgi:fyn-related kinase